MALVQQFWKACLKSSGKSYTYCVPIKCALYRFGWSHSFVGYGVETGRRCIDPSFVVPPMLWNTHSPFSDFFSAYISIWMMYPEVLVITTRRGYAIPVVGSV